MPESDRSRRRYRAVDRPLHPACHAVAKAHSWGSSIRFAAAQARRVLRPARRTQRRPPFHPALIGILHALIQAIALHFLEIPPNGAAT